MSIRTLKRDVGEKAVDLLIDISGDTEYPGMIAEIRAQFGVSDEVIYDYLSDKFRGLFVDPPDEEDDPRSLLDDYYNDEED